MAGDSRQGARGRRGFDPLWLLDLAGVAAAGLLAWRLAGAASLPDVLHAFPLLAELALAVAAVALAVRLADGMNRRRAARRAARQELLRRLSALDEALMDLRRSLSRETARRFVERRDDFAAGLETTLRRLDAEETRLARDGLAFCAVLTTGLADTIPRRAAIVSAGYRLGEEIDRAGRLGELDPAAAADLRGLAEDALAVMDEALFAEWNADHFGRLGAVQRHMGRILERCGEGETVRLIDREAASLFDRLVRHVREKIEVVDALRGWEDVRRPLEFALSDVLPRPRRRAPPPPPRPSVATRFALAPHAGSAGETEPAIRLPAAND